MWMQMRCSEKEGVIEQKIKLNGCRIIKPCDAVAIANVLGVDALILN